MRCSSAADIWVKVQSAASTSTRGWLWTDTAAIIKSRSNGNLLHAQINLKGWKASNSQLNQPFDSLCAFPSRPLIHTFESLLPVEFSKMFLLHALPLIIAFACTVAAHASQVRSILWISKAGPSPTPTFHEYYHSQESCLFEAPTIQNSTDVFS